MNSKIINKRTVDGWLLFLVVIITMLFPSIYIVTMSVQFTYAEFLSNWSYFFITVLGLYSGMMLYKHKKNAISVTKIYLVLLFVFTALVSSSIEIIIYSGLFSAAWLLYLNKSKKITKMFDGTREGIVSAQGSGKCLLKIRSNYKLGKSKILILSLVFLSFVVLVGLFYLHLIAALLAGFYGGFGVILIFVIMFLALSLLRRKKYKEFNICENGIDTIDKFYPWGSIKYFRKKTKTLFSSEVEKIDMVIDRFEFVHTDITLFIDTVDKTSFYQNIPKELFNNKGFPVIRLLLIIILSLVVIGLMY